MYASLGLNELTHYGLVIYDKIGSTLDQVMAVREKMLFSGIDKGLFGMRIEESGM